MTETYPGASREPLFVGLDGTLRQEAAAALVDELGGGVLQRATVCGGRPITSFLTGNRATLLEDGPATYDAMLDAGCGRSWARPISISAASGTTIKPTRSCWEDGLDERWKRCSSETSPRPTRSRPRLGKRRSWLDRSKEHIARAIQPLL